MNTVLVTGATGTLGTPTTAKLRAAGHDVRALSRKSGTGLTTGNLLTGEGIAAAMSGADTVVHLSTGARDVGQAATAIDAALAAGVSHFVLISIVGIDEIPLGYYRGKVRIEKYLKDSGLPNTILRATQFHQFVDAMISGQKYFPVFLAPKISFQPISTDEVAARLTELAGAMPAGRVPDIGGPEQLTAREIAVKVKNARQLRRPVWTMKIPGKTAAAFAAGHNLVPGARFGVATFDEYLEAKYGT